MHPSDDALVEVALGSEAVDLADAAHVRDCARCHARLAELAEVIALVRDGSGASFAEPSPAGWSRLAAALEDEPSVVAPAPHRSRSRLRAVGPWVAGLAAAAVIGIVVGRVTAPSAPAAPTETVVAHAALDEIDTTNVRGEADVVREGSGIRLVVRPDRLEAGPDWLEVWLINRDGKRMVSVGFLSGAGSQAFVIDQRLLDAGYVIVDISQEPLDGNPAHSGHSIVRGTLDT